MWTTIQLRPCARSAGSLKDLIDPEIGVGIKLAEEFSVAADERLKKGHVLRKHGAGYEIAGSELFEVSQKLIVAAAKLVHGGGAACI